MIETGLAMTLASSSSSRCGLIYVQLALVLLLLDTASLPHTLLVALGNWDAYAQNVSENHGRKTLSIPAFPIFFIIVSIEKLAHIFLW